MRCGVSSSPPPIGSGGGAVETVLAPAVCAGREVLSGCRHLFALVVTVPPPIGWRGADLARAVHLPRRWSGCGWRAPGRGPRTLGAGLRPPGRGAGQVGTRAWTPAGKSGPRVRLTPPRLAPSSAAASAIPGARRPSRSSSARQWAFGLVAERSGKVGGLSRRAGRCRRGGDPQPRGRSRGPTGAASAPRCSRPASPRLERRGAREVFLEVRERMLAARQLYLRPRIPARRCRPRYYRQAGRGCLVLRLALAGPCVNPATAGARFRLIGRHALPLLSDRVRLQSRSPEVWRFP